MSKPEVYIPVPSIQIEGFTHPTVQGVKASMIRSPFKEGHISQFSVVGVEQEEDNSNNANRSTTLIKISPMHGRSYEFVTGSYNEIRWSDQFGNIFLGLTIKGNNCSDTKVYQSMLAGSGFMFHGLQESDSTVRVLKASEILRSHGVDTEAIIKVIEPAQLPYNGELVPVQEFKKRLIEAVWNEDATEGDKCEDTGYLKVPRQQIPRLTQVLHDSTFFLTVRGQQVPERLEDLTMTSDGEGILAMICRALHFVNLDEAAKKRPQRFFVIPERNNTGDISRIFEYYLTEYLPKRVARNFATMHKSGLIHYYPHTGNISLVGSLYDLDSVRGEPLGLGDPPITDADKTDDARKFVDGNGHPAPIQILTRLGIRQPERFNFNFLKEYIKEMDWAGDISKFVYVYNLVRGQDQEDKEDQQVKELVNYYIHLLVIRHNLYQPGNPDQVVEFYVKEFLNLVKGRGESERELLGFRFLAMLAQKLAEDFFGGTLPTDDIDEPTRVSIKILAHVFTAKAYKALADAVEGSQELTKELGIPEKEDEAARQLELEFKKQLIYRLGWEGDIVAHIEDIEDFFERFYPKETCSYLHYYAEELAEQVGLRLDIEQTPEEVIAMFHKEDEEEARARLAEAFVNADGSQQREQIIHQALKKDPQDRFDRDFTWDHFARYTTYVMEYLSWRLETNHETRYRELVEQYGDDVMSVIDSWLTHKYADMYINDLPEEVEQNIERDSEIRMQVLRREYLSYAS